MENSNNLNFSFEELNELLEYLNGLKTAGPVLDGLGIYRSSAYTTMNTAAIGISSIETNGRTLQVGDLVIGNSTYSYLYRITAVDDDSVTVTYLQSLRGATGSSATVTVGKIYGVGAIYISTTNTSPASFLGGTWEAIGAGRVLVGAGSGYTAGVTGGEETHTLTIAEMPKHAHCLDVPFSNLLTTSIGEGLDVPNVTSNAWASPAYQYNHATMSKVGGNAAHNNMPPYLVVYMWQRKS